MINLIDQLETVDSLGVILAQKSEKKCFQNECLVRSSSCEHGQLTAANWLRDN